MGGSERRIFSSFKKLQEVAGKPEDQRELSEVPFTDEERRKLEADLASDIVDGGKPQSEPGEQDDLVLEGPVIEGSCTVETVPKISPEFVDLPKGMIAVSVCSIGDEFPLVHSIARKDRAYVLFPEKIIQTVPDRVPGPGGVTYMMGEKDVVRFAAIKEADHGWRAIEGLPCGGSCEFGTHWQVLTIRHSGRYLVPPPGLWPSDLPYRIKRRLIKPEKWVDIFAHNRERLALSEGPYGHPDRPGFIPIRVCASSWLIHSSRHGVQALLQRTCGGRVVVNRQSETAQIFVPPDEIGHWIGKDGSVVSQLKPILGVVKIDVIGDPNIPPLPD